VPSRKNKGAAAGASREEQLRQQREQQQAATATEEAPVIAGPEAPAREGWGVVETANEDMIAAAAQINAEDQAIAELAAELGISADLVREQVTSGELTLAQPEPPAEPAPEPVAEAAEETPAAPATPDAAMEEIDAQATLRDEVRTRLLNGFLPSNITADAVIQGLARGMSSEDLETLVNQQLEQLVPTTRKDVEVGSWWTDALRPDGAALKVDKLVPPLYVHSEGYGIFLPGQEFTEHQAGERNAALEAVVVSGSNGNGKAHGSNGVAHTNGATTTTSEPEAPAAPHPAAAALDIIQGLQQVYVDGNTDYELPAREDIERALASLEVFIKQPAPAPRAPRASSGGGGGGTRSTAATGEKLPPMRTGPDGKPLTRLWSAKVFGPYLMGAVSTGTVVRDTRTNERGAEFDRVSEAKKWVEDQKAAFKDAAKWAELEVATRACVGADGTAR
jgi:hypothetical protein